MFGLSTFPKICMSALVNFKTMSGSAHECTGQNATKFWGGRSLILRSNLSLHTEFVLPFLPQFSLGVLLGR